VLQRSVSVEAARLVGQRNLFQATVVEHQPAGAFTILDWGGRRLEAVRAAAFRPGQQAAWLIPPSQVVLQRRGRPSRGERQNPVSGPLAECVALGATTIGVIYVDGSEQRALTFQVPSYVAQRHRLAVGERVTVSLLAEAIHLMPWPDRGAPGV
jgi:molybdate transport system ATP-binding protein